MECSEVKESELSDLTLKVNVALKVMENILEQLKSINKHVKYIETYVVRNTEYNENS